MSERGSGITPDERACGVNGITVHSSMVVHSVRHRRLRRLIEDDNPQLLRQNLVDRVRKILTALILAEELDSFIADALRGWHVHRLFGDRQNEWSVSVSGNLADYV